MRIWHEDLIPKLCRQHLLAMWREGLGAYKIITENKNGYRNHPAVKEFENIPSELFLRLQKVRNEMIKRKYNPKTLPLSGYLYATELSRSTKVGLQPWQTLEEQIAILKQKGCECQI